MGGRWSSDPVADAERWIRHQDKRETEYARHCPVCDICGEPITEEYGYRIEDTWFHEECIEGCRRRV